MAFELPLRVYWEDTDAGGIVFYANYLKFFERARTEWLRSLGIGQQALREATGGIFVVSDATLKYHRAARLDDELVVSATLREAGRASIAIAQEARSLTHRQADGGTSLLCEGLIRVGWVDAATLRPARMPTHVLEALK